jgi:NitT/TauT family transport system substrate-binding protein
MTSTARAVRRLSAVALLATASASPSFAQGRGETLRIQDYPGTGNMLARIAIQKGYCEKNGIKCTVQMIPSSPLGLQALLAKSIDVALSPIETHVSAVLKGAKIKAVAAGATLVVHQVVVGTDFAWPNQAKGHPEMMKDYKGKKVGITARGASPEFLFNFMLTTAGMSVDDVTYVAVGAPNTAYGALISKQIDVLVSFEPTGVICEATKKCAVVWRGSEATAPATIASMNGAGSNLIMRDEQSAAEPHVLDAFIKSMQEAEVFAQNPANFEELHTIAAAYFKLEMPNGDAIMRAAMKVALPAYKASIKRSAAKVITDYMVATKQVDSAPSLADLIHAKAPD